MEKAELYFQNNPNIGKPVLYVLILNGVVVLKELNPGQSITEKMVQTEFKVDKPINISERQIITCFEIIKKEFQGIISFDQRTKIESYIGYEKFGFSNPVLYNLEILVTLQIKLN